MPLLHITAPSTYSYTHHTKRRAARLALALLLLTLAPVALANSLVVEPLGPEMVGVHVTPYGKGIWIGAGKYVKDGVSHVVKHAEVTPEDDGDTKVYLQFPHMAPAAGVWFLYDPDAQTWGAGSGADRSHIVAFPQAGIDASPAGTSPDELSVPWPRLQVLLVRGSNAWTGEFYNDGPGDLEPGPGVRLNVSGLEPLGAEAKPIATIEEGDFFAIVDLDRYVAALTWITANDLISGQIVRSQGGI